MLSQLQFVATIIEHSEHHYHDDSGVESGSLLVFADWLEEQGDPRSELIRVFVDVKTQIWQEWFEFAQISTADLSPQKLVGDGYEFLLRPNHNFSVDDRATTDWLIACVMYSICQQFHPTNWALLPLLRKNFPDLSKALSEAIDQIRTLMGRACAASQIMALLRIYESSFSQSNPISTIDPDVEEFIDTIGGQVVDALKLVYNANDNYIAFLNESQANRLTTIQEAPFPDPSEPSVGWFANIGSGTITRDTELERTDADTPNETLRPPQVLDRMLRVGSRLEETDGRTGGWRGYLIGQSVAFPLSVFAQFWCIDPLIATAQPIDGWHSTLHRWCNELATGASWSFLTKTLGCLGRSVTDDLVDSAITQFNEVWTRVLCSSIVMRHSEQWERLVGPLRRCRNHFGQAKRRLRS